jgi:hypothetical protein
MSVAELSRHIAKLTDWAPFLGSKHRAGPIFICSAAASAGHPLNLDQKN